MYLHCSNPIVSVNLLLFSTGRINNMNTSTVEPPQHTKTTSSAAFCEYARKVILTEARAVAELVDRINGDFAKACQYLLNCTKESGRIVVLGMGKSGHIGNKIAATLASTGSPAFFYIQLKQVMVILA